MDITLVGLLLIAIGLLLHGNVRANREMERHSLGTGLSSVSDLEALFGMVRDQVGSGLFAHRAGLQGMLECDTPLVSELSSEPCAAYRYRVQRRWEEHVEERDANGRRVTRTRSGFDVVAANERRAPFRLRDATGGVMVDPDGARLDMEKRYDRFEPGEPGNVIRRGLLELPIRRSPGYPGRRTVGYHFVEEVLALGRSIYVLGTAIDRSGALVIANTVGSGEPFVVSLKTRDQLILSARKAASVGQAAALGCESLGVLLLVVSVVVHR